MAARVSRRKFLKLGAVFAGATTTIGAASSQAFYDFARSMGSKASNFPMFRANAQTTGELIAANGEPMQHSVLPVEAPSKHRWVMVIDLAKCDGCKECTAACGSNRGFYPSIYWFHSRIAAASCCAFLASHHIWRDQSPSPAKDDVCWEPRTGGQRNADAVAPIRSDQLARVVCALARNIGKLEALLPIKRAKS